MFLRGNRPADDRRNHVNLLQDRATPAFYKSLGLSPIGNLNPMKSATGKGKTEIVVGDTTIQYNTV
jgi:hypothetical protein